MWCLRMRHDPHRCAEYRQIFKNFCTGIRANGFQIIPFRMADDLNLLGAVNFSITRHGKAWAVKSAFFDARIQIFVGRMRHQLQILAVANKKVPHRETFAVQDLDVFQTVSHYVNSEIG